jgi:hypothetical protein
MENQHQHIKGYRDLSPEEIALMNEGKALAEQCGAYIEKLRAMPATGANGIPFMTDAADNAPAQPSLDHRWISIGATDLQRGFMAVIRGIAQPTNF